MTAEDVPDSGAPDIIDNRDRHGRFAKGNTLSNLAKRDPVSGFPVPKEAGMAVVRLKDGTMQTIPLPVQQLEQLLHDRFLAKHKDMLAEEREQVLSEARDEARVMFAEMIEHAGGDPLRLITARMATHVQNGKMLKAVDALMDKAAEGNVRSMEMMLRLLGKIEEMSGARGGDNQASMSDEEAAAMLAVVDRHGDAEGTQEDEGHAG